MSMLPFTGPSAGNEMLKQLAIAKMMQDPSAQAENMSVTGTLVGGTVTHLREQNVRAIDGLAREMEIIAGMSVSDDIKAQLQMQAQANHQGWTQLMMRTGENISGLVR